MKYEKSCLSIFLGQHYDLYREADNTQIISIEMSQSEKLCALLCLYILNMQSHTM